jgi:hypothetical protein
MQRMVANGYKPAYKLKLDWALVGANQIEGRATVLTEPNTSERRELLTQVKMAGQRFHITNGGGPLNSTDALVAFTQKMVAKKALALTKKKAGLQNFQETVDEVKSLLDKKLEDCWRDWTVKELKLFICWKQGHTPQDPYKDQYKNLAKRRLQQLYTEKYKDAPNPIDSIWTDEMENEFTKLENREDDELYVDVGIKRAMDRDDEELETRLKTKCPNRRAKLTSITKGFCSLPLQGRQDVFSELMLLVNDVDNEEIMQGAIGDVFDSDGDGSDAESDDKH